MDKQDKIIIVIGANPAWQKTLTFKSLNVGDVNRAETIDCFHSGKGINFARVTNASGKYQSKLFQFAGGDTGKMICAGLDKEAIQHVTIKVKASTRVCTTCLCRKSGEMTELIEPSQAVTKEQLNEMFNAVERDIKDCAGMAICGTLPTGTDIQFYVKLAALANQYNIPLLIDSWQDIVPVLSIAINAILKINYSELKQITGAMSQDAAIAAAIARFPIQAVAITDGPGNAYLGNNQAAWKYILPRLDNVVNPLGSGDTVAAVFFSEYLSRTAIDKAFAAGLAAASASCLTPRCGSFSPAVMQEILQQIKINRQSV
jgi:1-phosphofructokinase family hexose kinase